MNARRAPGWSAVPRIALVLALACTVRGAQPPEPGGDRPPVPEPPEQGRPWTPPETGLPRFLVKATALLFDQGVPDPRGCEYRTIDFGTTEVPMFVLPEVPGDARRYAIDEDGVLREAPDVWGRADLAADVRALAEDLKAAREPAEPGVRMQAGPVGLFFRGGQVPGNPRTTSPMQVCLLLRVGRADLAEELFAAATNWTPGGPRRDVTDYGVSYLSLARGWADLAYTHALDAHKKSDDVLALAHVRRLDRLTRAATAALRETRVPLPNPNGGGWPASTTYFPELRQISVLLADQERRAKASEKGRVPVPPPGGDPSARVAALVRNLGQIAQLQNSIPGGAFPARSETARALVAEGDAAVPALLDALESDERLTRSVSNGRGFGSSDGYIHPVHEVAADLLYEILKTEIAPGTPRVTRFGLDPSAGRKAAVATLRAAWERKQRAKAGAVSPSVP